MATTTILLREDVDNLGGRGEIVKVRAGYARNYLLPKKLAMEATKGNVRQVEQERAALLRKEAHDKATAVAQAEQFANIKLDFIRKAGEHGLLYGSVTSMDIAEALHAKGYEVDRRRILLKDNIKEVGDYTVNVKLHREVVIEIPVVITAEGAEEKEEKKPEKAKGKKAKTESEIEGPTYE